MYRLVSLVLLLFLGCQPQCPPRYAEPQRSYKDVIDKMVARTVQVHCVLEDGGGTGSGVILGSLGTGTIIATATHVIDDCDEVKIGDDLARVVAVHEDDDAALLYLERRNGLGSVAWSREYLGMDVVAVGYPRHYLLDDTQLQVTGGTLAAKYEDSNLWKITAQITPGSSGGPIFDTEGRLVGIANSYLRLDRGPTDGEYYIVPYTSIRELEWQLPRSF